MSTYVTSSGDMWDSIAYKLFGNTSHTNSIMKANRQHLGYYTFPAGITLEIPAVDDTSLPNYRPPWKEVSG